MSLLGTKATQLCWQNSMNIARQYYDGPNSRAINRSCFRTSSCRPRGTMRSEHNDPTGAETMPGPQSCASATVMPESEIDRLSTARSKALTRSRQRLSPHSFSARNSVHFLIRETLCSVSVLYLSRHCFEQKFLWANL